MNDLFGPRVLALGPHTDDIEIAMGGTIAKLTNTGAQVRALVFSPAIESLPPGFGPDSTRNECAAALSQLGISEFEILSLPVRTFDSHRQLVLDRLVELRREWRPTSVFAPSPFDHHQDHSVVFQECRRAFTGWSNIYGYDTPWNGESSGPSLVVELTRLHIDTKTRAVAEYASQAAKESKYIRAEFLESLARVRGVKEGFEFAERFDVIRLRQPGAHHN